MIVLRVVAGIAGGAVVIATFASAIRTVVLPRAIPARLTRWIFLSMRALFRIRARPSASYEVRDRVMAMYAPVSLIVLGLSWLAINLLSYWAIFWSFGGRSVREALLLSGSSLLTLGFERAGDLPSQVLSFSEAALGLLFLALIITYLPSIYSVFSQREAGVAMLEVRAGLPPSGVEMIERYFRIRGLDELHEVWEYWERWFTSLGETHTSFPAVVFFRSPVPYHSWVTSAGAVLDAAALRASTVDMEREPRAELCIRAGYIALRRVATFFRVPYDPDPKPDDPISINREEFDAAYDELRERGVPVKADRDQAWRDFAGWRVNYDTVLVALAGLTMAPMAPWSSDRSIRGMRPTRILGPRHSSD
ncbi:MAG: hypothetical protein LC722_00155 [Actinobacteria bacterium]|nr:hypothetical protein [Actinomycetota bacterium]